MSKQIRFVRVSPLVYAIHQCLIDAMNFYNFFSETTPQTISFNSTTTPKPCIHGTIQQIITAAATTTTATAVTEKLQLDGNSVSRVHCGYRTGLFSQRNNVKKSKNRKSTHEKCGTHNEFYFPYKLLLLTTFNRDLLARTLESIRGQQQSPV